MSSFKGIEIDEDVIEEIMNDNQLRNKRKKIRQLLSKRDDVCENSDKFIELSEKIKIIIF